MEIYVDNTKLGGSVLGPYPVVRIVRWDADVAAANEKLRYDERCREEDYPHYIVQMPPSKLMPKGWLKPVSHAYVQHTP